MLQTIEPFMRQAEIAYAYDYEMAVIYYTS